MLVGKSTDPKPKRVFITALAVLGLMVWFSFIALSVHYSATRPRRPSSDSGRVYELNNHGSYAYLTKSEQWRLWSLEFGGMTCLLAAAIIAQLWNISTDSSPDLPKNVRDQIMKRPHQDYDKIRATYAADGKEADQP